MKIFISMLLGLCLLGCLADSAAAQRSKTIILVRHAEKDASEAADQNDPDLSPAGRERAERLLKVIRKYRPGAIYSTDFKRTRLTVEPIARHRHLEIQSYDPKAQDRLVAEIMNRRTKRFVIAGHSNTIPLLANLLIKKEVFKPLDDSEFGVIWIIKIKEGNAPKVELQSY